MGSIFDYVKRRSMEHGVGELERHRKRLVVYTVSEAYTLSPGSTVKSSVSIAQTRNFSNDNKC